LKRRPLELESRATKKRVWFGRNDAGGKGGNKHNKKEEKNEVKDRPKAGAYKTADLQRWHNMFDQAGVGALKQLAAPEPETLATRAKGLKKRYSDLKTKAKADLREYAERSKYQAWKKGVLRADVKAKEAARQDAEALAGLPRPTFFASIGPVDRGRKYERAELEVQQLVTENRVMVFGHAAHPKTA
jgi:hypothetical protein